QGIAAGLDIAEKVTSPTFIFVNEYETPAGYTLIHIDSYRLGDEPDAAVREAFTFGLDEILNRDDAIVVIEWADRLTDLLPADHLQITLTYTDDLPDQRQIAAVAHGPVSAALLAEWHSRSSQQ
ncbi:MAG: tRNA (adenosine(37)-N6)-threonylcarbamoyltransferase complex ATPase subunit type 1 TsaE, partial [Caldilineaceae bacterium]|nr:tRNA (adenosine(37)-N6)-threonylcarbamoyltransferase complex ATPase subunit type 1 TsaE [Caldilineaceae bacterium]